MTNIRKRLQTWISDSSPLHLRSSVSSQNDHVVGDHLLIRNFWRNYTFFAETFWKTKFKKLTSQKFSTATVCTVCISIYYIYVHMSIYAVYMYVWVYILRLAIPKVSKYFHKYNFFIASLLHSSLVRKITIYVITNFSKRKICHI